MRAELSPYALDPFGPSANPNAYVACEASERARAMLEQSLDAGRVAAVMGPPGYGKTLLLRLIGAREQEHARVAYVPFCTLEIDDLCAVVLNAIGVSRPGPPREALAAATRELATRGGVVILVDDANALSDSCAAALSALYTELAGSLRIALAAVQGPAAQRVFRAFGSAIDVVVLAGGMTGSESRRYVETRLAYGGARPELIAAFDDATIDALHRASQGVPRRLNQAAEDVVRRATRAALPRLRELTGAGPTAPLSVRVVAEMPAPSPEPATPPPERTVIETTRLRAVPPPPPIAPAEPLREANSEAPREPDPKPSPTPMRIPPLRPSAPRVPIAPASPPPPRPDSAADDGRGVLLPGIFDRVPGEPAGEYRIVRGAPQPTRTSERASTPLASAESPRAVPESVLVAAASETPGLRREVPMPSEYADRVPARGSPPWPVSIRLVGLGGFMLGVGISVAWMMIRAPEQPHLLVPNPYIEAPGPPAPDAPAVPTAPGEAVAPPAQPTASAAPARVSVSINATPWAIVRIDGREVGETPLAGIELDPGTHVFQARMPDGKTLQQTIQLSGSHASVVFP